MNGIACAFEGYLANDAELRFTGQGKPVASFSVAVLDTKKAEGAETEWVRVTLWEQEAERLAPTLRKGCEVYVSGRLKQRTWQTQDGQTRASIECSAWECVIKGAIGRKAPPRPSDRMHEWEAAH